MDSVPEIWRPDTTTVIDRMIFGLYQAGCAYMSVKIIKTAAVLFAAALLLTACGGGAVEESGPESSIAESSSAVSAPTPVSSDDTAVSQAPESGSSEIQASSEQPPLTVAITIPEGYTLARIGMMLEEKGICTADEFIAASQNGDFSEFSLVAAQAENPNRCFKLEGLLFPDTYEIYTDDTPDAIIRKILAHTEEKIGADIRAQIEESGYTADEIITMASIIQKEAFGDDPMPLISSVLHNRLNEGMRLECDVTITYVEGAIKPFITGDVNRYNSYYNTYKCRALPAGAICNPGLSAIRAALSPAESDYLFFVTDKSKKYYFAATWEEHEANLVSAGIKTDS